ncbi:hypothetical protein [Actinomyces sp. ZJ751]|uniref:hypothetical protein n=1 Tax=Actinomyces sp. ZJ751 TaxID=2708341 RepID=UPI001424A3E7|nr:hypothetical protein [Actinomyces sp. ZJ751]
MRSPSVVSRRRSTERAPTRTNGPTSTRVATASTLVSSTTDDAPADADAAADAEADTAPDEADADVATPSGSEPFEHAAAPATTSTGTTRAPRRLSTTDITTPHTGIRTMAQHPGT